MGWVLHVVSVCLLFEAYQGWHIEMCDHLFQSNVQEEITEIHNVVRIKLLIEVCVISYSQTIGFHIRCEMSYFFSF